jgi:oxygen-independent coproporphyrinogen-3 oxidase
MYPPVTEEQLFSGYSLPSDGLFAVYAHIPFCIRACVFCHYPGKYGSAPEEKDAYLAAIARETDIYLARLGVSRIRARCVLVGGGTPTDLTPEQLRRFLEDLTRRVDLSSCTQFSYDVDPSTLLGEDGARRLKIMRSYGVDRLTIGVQSLDDAVLKRMSRAHDAADVVAAIEASQKAGFKLNIEFVFGHPGQTPESWARVVAEAAGLGVEEIQLYRLKIAPYGDKAGPVLGQFARRPEDFPSVTETLVMKKAAMLILDANGYHENLTRVFSRERKDFSHYAADQCCNLFDQIGLGLTAFSSLRDRFGLNTQDFGEYHSRIKAGRLPLNRGLVRDRENQARWAIILPLKNRNVPKALFQQRTGMPLDGLFREKIGLLKDRGLLAESAAVLTLTPLGRFFADEVCHQFHHPDYIPFPKSAYAAGELNPYQHNRL